MNDFTVRIYGENDIYYYKNGRLYTIDTQVYIWPTGSIYSYVNQRKQKILIGTTIIYANKDKYYYQNSLLHREDGPAVEYFSGTKKYYIKGKRFSEEEFTKRKS